MAKDKMAFGVEPAPTRYHLRLARYPALAETIAKYVRGRTDSGPAELLDIGVGNGRTMRYLDAEDVVDHVRFHGIDMSPKRLANLYGEVRWNVVQGNVEEGLPWPAQQFDVAVCEQVLEHLNDPAQVIRETARVMKPGGILILGVPIFPPGVSFLRHRVVPLIDRVTGKTRDHVQAFTKRSLVNLVKRSAAFDVVAVRGFRVMSGGPLRPLENFRWWWRFNATLGRVVPSLCTEVQVVARRRAVVAAAAEAEATTEGNLVAV